MLLVADRPEGARIQLTASMDFGDLEGRHSLLRPGETRGQDFGPVFY